MDKMYNPQDWYWVVGDDTSRCWSSAAGAYVTEVPKTFTRIASENELRNVLANAGCAHLAPGYVPQSVPLWKAREQIRRAGLFDKVDAALQAFGGAPLAAWEYATEVRRNSAIIEQLGTLLGLTEEQLDTLFIEASKIDL